MVENFSRLTATNPDEWSKQAYPSILFLRDLEQQNRISYWEERGGENLGTLITIRWPTWYDEANIFANITSTGMDYCDNYDKDNLLRLTNWAVIIGVVATFFISLFTARISGNSYDLSVRTFEYSKHNDTTLSVILKHQDTSSKQLKSLQSLPKKSSKQLQIPKRKHG